MAVPGDRASHGVESSRDPGSMKPFTKNTFSFYSGAHLLRGLQQPPLRSPNGPCTSRFGPVGGGQECSHPSIHPITLLSTFLHFSPPSSLLVRAGSSPESEVGGSPKWVRRPQSAAVTRLPQGLTAAAHLRVLGRLGVRVKLCPSRHSRRTVTLVASRGLSASATVTDGGLPTVTPPVPNQSSHPHPF